MSLSLIVQIIFLVIALGLVLNAFWPSALSLPGPSWAVGPKVFLWLVIELFLLWIVYVLVSVLFLGAPNPVHAEAVLAGAFLVGAVDPTPAPAPTPAPTPDPAPSGHTGNYPGHYWLNVVLVSLSVLSVIANVLAAQSAAFLGVSEITWHWVLLAAATVTALNAAFNRTPPVTAPPTPERMLVERQVHEIRKWV